MYKQDHIKVLKVLASEAPKRAAFTTSAIVEEAFKRTENGDRRVRNAYRKIRKEGHAEIVDRGEYRLTPSGVSFVQKAEKAGWKFDAEPKTKAAPKKAEVKKASKAVKASPKKETKAPKKAPVKDTLKKAAVKAAPKKAPAKATPKKIVKAAPKKIIKTSPKKPVESKTPVKVAKKSEESSANGANGAAATPKDTSGAQLAF